jgi:PAS domain-containing protein
MIDMQYFKSACAIIFSSLYVLMLDVITYSSRTLERTLVLPIIIMLIICYRIPIDSIRQFMNEYGRWILLIWGTIFVQILIISTGGLNSPFLILVHIFMISLSFFISFQVAVLFLTASFAVIFIDLSLSQNLNSFILADPSLVILQLTSLIVIIPIAYIISQQYHMKDMLFTMLRLKTKTDEAVIKRLREMIIVTDTKLNILSVNASVEKTLQKSKSELLKSPIFEALSLRDKTGALVSADTFFTHDFNVKRHNGADAYILLRSSLRKRSVYVSTQPVRDLKGKVVQIIFIISGLDTTQSRNDIINATLEKARGRYEAMRDNLIHHLSMEDSAFMQAQLTVLNEIENDIYTAQLFSISPAESTKTLIDLAKLSRHIVQSNLEFAKAFKVPIDFGMFNFGWNDIAPLTVKSYPVIPEQLTGPFFTASCDVVKLELMVKKILHMAICLASTEPDPQVILSIGRQKADLLVIKITGRSAYVKKERLSDLFIPFYGALFDATALHSGSGLEGYLVSILSADMCIPVKTVYIPSLRNVEFTLSIAKNVHLA